MVAAETLPPAIFLLGPTAAGKTDLAVAIAEQLPVEIISADSAMVYRGLDIGTAKPDAALLARAPHRLIDIRDPLEPYSVAEFLRDARHEMAAITAMGRIPLLVGGTMLYFRALLDGLTELPAAHPDLRRQLTRDAQTLGWPGLHARLAAIDPETAATLHPNHSQRIQRALEIYQLTGVAPSALRRVGYDADRGVPPLGETYRVIQLALLPQDRARLHGNIAQRFQHMIEQGLLDEVEALYRRSDLSVDLPSLRAVGYRQLWGCLAGDYNYEEAIARALAATRQLAKRQLTWLRNWNCTGVTHAQIIDPTALPRADILTKALGFMRTSSLD